MNVVSLCSGVGGMDRGLEAAGMTPLAFCEIDPHARAVLGHHWPTVPCHDDITTFDGGNYRGAAHVVAGGTPCTDLSVAGGRAGLVGNESRLFWDLCRVADSSSAHWVLWENVPGALTSNAGRDFAAVLWGFTGCRPEVPADGWRSIGVCVGPRRTAVWRVLDARWFGVAQRRSRVFVVAGARDRCGLEILAESESVPRDNRQVRSARQEVAGTLGGGTPGGGWRPDTDRMTFLPFQRQGHGDYRTADGASTLRTRAGDGTSTDLVACVEAVTENLRGEVRLTPYANALSTGGGKPGQGHAVIAFAWQNGGGYGDANPGLAITEDGTGPLVSSSTPAVTAPAGVRRLTPRECERLMGWPDDWTRWRADGREVADSHRYRMCGNGVVSPVAEWIGRRIISACGY